MKTKKIIFFIVLVFLLISCDGNEDNMENPLSIKISINDRVVITEDKIKIEYISENSDDTFMLVEGEIKEASELVNKIIFIPPSDNAPNGFFMKVKTIEKYLNTTGKINSKISYIVPELDEVINNMELKKQNIITSNSKATQVMIPTATNISSSSPSLKQYNTSDITRLSTDSKSNTGIMFSNSQEAISVKYLGDKTDNHYKFSFDELEIWKDINNSNNSTSRLIKLDGNINFKLKNITPSIIINKDNGQYNIVFNTDFETIIDTNITLEGDFNLSLSKLLKENTKLQCGDLKDIEDANSTDSNYYSTFFSGEKWKDNLCLGGIHLILGNVSMITNNEEEIKIPVSIDIFLTMNSKLEVNTKANLVLSNNKTTKTELNINIKDENLKKRLTSTQESYDSILYKNDNIKKPAILNTIPSGKFKGSSTTSIGLAIGLRVANIYPLIVESLDSMEINGEISILSSLYDTGEKKMETCSKIAFNPKIDIYSSIGLASKKTIDFDTLFNDTPELSFYFNYQYDLEKIESLNTCLSFESNISYDISYTSSGLSIKNIKLEDETKKIDKITFSIYDKDNNIVKEYFNNYSPIFHLEEGEYILRIFIQLESGEQYLDSKIIKIGSVIKNLQISRDDNNRTIITWDNISDVSEYTLCLSEKEINNICSLDDSRYSTSSNSYILPDFDLVNGKLYNIFVYYEIDEVKHYSEVKSFEVNPNLLEFNLNLKSITSKGFNLSWDSVEGASTYKVCQSSKNEVSYDGALTCNNLSSGYFINLTSSLNALIDTYGVNDILDKYTVYYFRVVAYDDSDISIKVSSLVRGQLKIDDDDEEYNDAINDLTANAGNDKTIILGESITLNGDQSSIDSGKITSYEWSENGILLSSDKIFITNTLSLGIHHISLTIKDNNNNSNTDNITITVSEAAIFSMLIANAGENQTINKDENITFDGSKSSNNDEPIAIYKWEENEVLLSNNKIFTISNLSIGIHIITLTIENNIGGTDSDTIIITVLAKPSIKKSGQIASYNIRDDGYYQKGVEFSYQRDDAKNILIDNITKLQWQDDENSQQVKQNWEDAIDYCENSVILGGYTNWRLPTRKELRSIMNYNNENNSIDLKFQNIVSRDYWSSTTYIKSITSAWLLKFSYGGQDYIPKTRENHVRCVRNQ